jgi:hypothetical protein
VTDRIQRQDGRVILIGLDIGLLVVYVFAAGPLAWLFFNRLIPSGIFNCLLVIYTPLTWCMQWGPFAAFMQWWFGVWGVYPPAGFIWVQET